MSAFLREHVLFGKAILVLHLLALPAAFGQQKAIFKVEDTPRLALLAQEALDQHVVKTEADRRALEQIRDKIKRLHPSSPTFKEQQDRYAHDMVDVISRANGVQVALLEVVDGLQRVAKTASSLDPETRARIDALTRSAGALTSNVGDLKKLPTKLEIEATDTAPVSAQGVSLINGKITSQLEQVLRAGGTGTLEVTITNDGDVDAWVTVEIVPVEGQATLNPPSGDTLVPARKNGLPGQAVFSSQITVQSNVVQVAPRLTNFRRLKESPRQKP
jgi:hypothetical protein